MAAPTSNPKTMAATALHHYRGLNSLRSANIAINASSQTFPPEIPADKQAILEAIHRL